jgi:hypothetical protein
MNKYDQEPLIKPTSNVFIAVLFSAPKNAALLCSIINAVLQDNDSNFEPVETVTVLNPFNIKDNIVDKNIIFDLRVVDQLGRAFNIEIQTYPHVLFRERIIKVGRILIRLSFVLATIIVN